MKAEGTGNTECMVTVLKLISYALEFSHVLEVTAFYHSSTALVTEN